MRVTRFGAWATGCAVLLFTITLIGCGDSNPPKPGDKGTDSGTKEEKKTKTALKPGTGTFKGKVTLVGEMPDIDALNKELKAQMDKADATQKPHCITNAPKEQKEEQDWKIGSDKGVADVFVYFKPVSGTFFACDADDAVVKAVKDKTVTLDQPHCAFIPHALVLFSNYRDGKDKLVPTGEKLVVKNSAEIAHNTKVGDVNLAIPPKEDKTPDLPRPSYTPVGISCSIHTWMNANLLNLDHPYAAKTNEKGEFEIKNVPAGKVNVVLWHPRGEGKGKEIEFKAGDTKTENFELKVK